MPEPNVRTARAEELEAITHTMTMAFSTDPAGRWIFPNALDFVAHFPGFVDAYCGISVDRGTAFVTDGLEAVAMWLDPDASVDEQRLQNYIEQHFPAAVQEDMAGVIGEMERYHPDDESCWYLPFIGVDVYYQRRGLGARLMKTMTFRLDESRAPAYLESTNPANISLYERHGFEVMGEIQVGSSPVFTPMLRTPR